MRKIIYIFPAALAAAVYGILVWNSGLESIDGRGLLSIFLLGSSAYMMLKNYWQGCMGGILVGIFCIWMSTQYTGQPVDIERPVGIFLCTYYVLCGWELYKKSSKKK